MDANKFITFNLLSYEPQEALKKFENRWSDLIHRFKENETVRIRIMSNDKSVVEGCSQIAKTLYNDVIVDQSSVVKREQLIENVAMNLDELPMITPENIWQLVIPIIKKAYPNVSEETVKKVIDAVGGKKEIVNGNEQ